MKKKYYSEVKRLSKAEPNSNDEIVLIPGLNIFKSGPFKSINGNNLVTSLFAYKEHIYLNSDRYIDEGELVFNEIQFISNVKLFELTGIFITGFHHEEMHINLNNKDWTLKKFNLCKDLECLPKNSNQPQFILKYEFNHHFLTYCQIDQIEDSDDSHLAFRLLKTSRKINDVNYVKALAKCSKLLKDYVRSAKKTTIVTDLQDLQKKNYGDARDKSIIEFSLSQKKIIYNHVKLFNNRIMKEFNKDIFLTFKSKYV
jgi:hypothetical protein